MDEMSISYETLDLLADSYTPLLGLVALSLIFQRMRAGDWPAVRRQLFLLLTGLVLVYGLMWLDLRWSIWPQMGMDYSTHTALALMLVLFVRSNNPRAGAIAFLTLLGYFILMLYQRYHTVADIASTGLVVAGSYWLIAKSFTRAIAETDNNRYKTD